jgi:hypothetical protein
VGIEHNSSSVRYVDLFQQTEEILIVLPRNVDSDSYNLKRKEIIKTVMGAGLKKVREILRIC